MKYQYKHPTERVLIFIIVAIIALMAAIIWAYGQKIDILWNGQPVASTSDKTLSPDLRQALQSAQRSLYSPAAVDAAAKKVYFPSLKIYVPLTDKSETYMYSKPLEQGAAAEYGFSALSIVNTYMNNLDEISCLAKPAGVSVGKASGSWKESDKAGTVKLADGRTLYLYKHSAAGCKGTYAYVSPDDIVASLKEASSY